jgi:hypothetical protein
MHQYGRAPILRCHMRLPPRAARIAWANSAYTDPNPIPRTCGRRRARRVMTSEKARPEPSIINKSYRTECETDETLRRKSACAFLGRVKRFDRSVRDSSSFGMAKVPYSAVPGVFLRSVWSQYCGNAIRPPLSADQADAPEPQIPTTLSRREHFLIDASAPRRLESDTARPS